MHNQVKQSEIHTKTESELIVTANKRENLCIVQPVDKSLTNEEIVQQAKAQGFELSIDVIDIASMVINGARETVKEIAKTQGLNYHQPAYYFLLVPSYLNYLKTEKECYGNEGLQAHLHSLTKTFISVTGAATLGMVGAAFVGLVTTGPIAIPMAVFAGGFIGAQLPSSKYEEYDYDYLVNYLTELKDKVLSENSNQLQEIIKNIPTKITQEVNSQWQDLIKEQAEDPIQFKDKVYNNSNISSDKQKINQKEAERIRKEKIGKELAIEIEQLHKKQVEENFKHREEQNRVFQMQMEQHQRRQEEYIKRSQENYDKMQLQQKEMLSQKIEPLYGSLLTNKRLMGLSDVGQSSCSISYTPAVTLPGSDHPTIMPFETDCNHNKWPF